MRDVVVDKRGSLVAQGREPSRHRLGWLKGRIVEIVAPAEALRLPIAGPALEAERREIHRLQVTEQLAFFVGGDELRSIVEAREQRLSEEVGLLHLPNSSAISDGRNSGASCSNVHCFGALSGRQRSRAVPWRKRRPVT